METIRVKRKIKHRDTGVEREFIDEIKVKEIQCIYKDRFGVYLSLTTGFLIKVEELTIDELQSELRL